MSIDTSIDISTTATYSLPRDLRSESAGMPLSEFVRTYSPSTGPIRIGSASSTPRGCGRHEFTVTLAIGDSIRSYSAIAFGPAEALTTMLHDNGIHLEILSFHQQPTDRGTATFVRCQRGAHVAWALGLGDDAAASTFSALVAGANRLVA